MNYFAKSFINIQRNCTYSLVNIDTAVSDLAHCMKEMNDKKESKLILIFKIYIQIISCLSVPSFTEYEHKSIGFMWVETFGCPWDFTCVELHKKDLWISSNPNLTKKIVC